MTRPAQLWIVAGPNGAGKTTCVQREPIRGLIPKTVRFLNPDDVTRQLLVGRGYAGFTDAPTDVQIECFRLAAGRVEHDLDAAVASGASVGVETVLSTDKYRAVVEATRQAGGLVSLLYITVATPDIAVRRVALRVASGGHGVPSDKVIDRFARSHARLTWFAAHADHFWVLDNTGGDPDLPTPLLAYGSGGRLEHLTHDAPAIVQAALATLPRAG